MDRVFLIGLDSFGIGAEPDCEMFGDAETVNTLKSVSGSDALDVPNMTIPLLAPICKELGVDLIWFGVYITLLVQIGQVTPPMGLNLFMVQGIDKEAKLNDIIRGVIPFLIGMLIFAVLMIMFPQMTAWLPEVMGF